MCFFFAWFTHTSHTHTHIRTQLLLNTLLQHFVIYFILFFFIRTTHFRGLVGDMKVSADKPVKHRKFSCIMLHLACAGSMPGERFLFLTRRKQKFIWVMLTLPGPQAGHGPWHWQHVASRALTLWVQIQNMFNYQKIKCICKLLWK